MNNAGAEAVKFVDLIQRTRALKHGMSFDRIPAAHRAMAMRRIDSLEAGHAICEGRDMLMLASNNYLGLAADPRVTQAGGAALHAWGNSTSGSRLLNGTTALHVELETRLARFKNVEACALFSSGYLANLGVLTALANAGDYVVMDKLAHASLVDGTRLAGAHLRCFRHQDMRSLDKVLASIPAGASVLVVVDGIYSMNGDFAKLPEIAALAGKYGATLMVDDAHATGVAGANGRGTAEHFCMAEADIVTGTLSKAFGCVGGFVAGSGEMVDFVKHNARSFIYSTSLPPSTVAALLAAVGIIETEPQRRENLWKTTHYLLDGLQALGYDTGASETPIIPVIFRDQAQMFEMTIRLNADGIFVSPVIYPACARNAPRVRMSLGAEHTIADMDSVIDAFRRHRVPR